MKNIWKNIFALIIFGVFVFLFRTTILNDYYVLQDKYFPCSRPISYSIGSFDTSFGISKADFLSDIQQAEMIWEKSINNELFVYKIEGGDLKINLIFDNRQANTFKLKDINQTIEGDKTSYNNLKSKLDSLQKEYSAKKSIFDSKVVALEDSRKKYEDQVTYWNNQGGAPKVTYDQLNQEKKNIESAVAIVNQLQSDLNISATEINNLINQLNSFASSVNGQVKNYNTINNSLGQEFEEGSYVVDQNGKQIDIYQFENKDKLIRVLVHELGHALDLEHVDNKNAVMYRLNDGINLNLTVDDINLLKAHCGIK